MGFFFGSLANLSRVSTNNNNNNNAMFDFLSFSSSLHIAFILNMREMMMMRDLLLISAPYGNFETNHHDTDLRRARDEITNPIWLGVVNEIFMRNFKCDDR